MRALLGVLLLTLLGVGITRWAIEAGDADTLVQPPENVAKAFVTHLQCRRPGPAHDLTSEGSCGLDEARVRQLVDEVRERYPHIQHIDATEKNRVAVAAATDVVLHQRGGHEEHLPVRLVREQGEWRVQCLTLP
jgi:hypothetical protein